MAKRNEAVSVIESSDVADPHTLPGGIKIRDVLKNMCPSAPVGREPSRDDKVRILAYLKWEQATGGNAVDDEKTRQFWYEAEQEVDADGTRES